MTDPLLGQSTRVAIVIECIRCGCESESFARPSRCLNQDCDGRMVERRYVPEREFNRLRNIMTEMASTMRDVLSVLDTQPDYPWQSGTFKQQIREDITAYELLGFDAD